ncbi:hypothetical protein [Pantoea dispersa]|uniref:hypothetical protein n=1 Tax=Pantoea dispersa TaxID=59814 RepID=UPI001F51D6FF|nr:hypothetical protein [Pantoea dispersa]MCI1029619.1 hypothetical protein [Pantoea dispersa]
MYVLIFLGLVALAFLPWLMGMARAMFFLGVVNCLLEGYWMLTYLIGDHGFAFIWTRSGFAPSLFAVGLLVGFCGLKNLNKQHRLSY